MVGVLRKPRLTYEIVGGGPSGGGQRRERLASIAIQPDGHSATDLVYAQAADLTFSTNGIVFGSQAYTERPPRVTFDIDPNDPRRAVNVRLA
ncbi:MAG TPA: hypothetical protein VGD94_15385 [Vicinamibacterales bacterium]